MRRRVVRPANAAWPGQGLQSRQQLGLAKVGRAGAGTVVLPALAPLARVGAGRIARGANQRGIARKQNQRASGQNTLPHFYSDQYQNKTSKL